MKPSKRIIIKGLLILAGIFVCLFSIVKLIVWPQSEAYYSSGLWELFAGMGFFILPFVGGLFFVAGAPNYRKGDWRLLVYGTSAFVLVIGSIVAYIVIMIPYNHETKHKMDAFTTHYQADLDDLKQIVLLANDVPYTNPAFDFDQLHLKLHYTDPMGGWPSTALDFEEGDTWYHTLFGEDTFDQLRRYRTDLPSLPVFDCRVVYVFVWGEERSGRSIELDRGSVPEYLSYVDVFAVDTYVKTRMKYPDRIYGPPAEVPSRGLGGGVLSISKLVGKKPSFQEIERQVSGGIRIP